MILVAVGSGLGLVALPIIMWRFNRRLSPARWAQLTTAALISGSCLIVGAGVMTSMSTVLWSIGLPELAHECDLMMGQAIPAGSPIAMAIAALTVSTVALGARALWICHVTNRRSWMEVGVGTRISRRGPCEYVLLADSRPHALSVPATSGRTSQVILTTGLLEALTPYEIDLVCAHEEAHLRHRHSHYLAAALVVERAVWFWPPARTSARTLRLALERWADEDAAGDEQSSRNRLRSALVTVATQSEFSGLAAFSGMDGLIERLSALDKPPGSTGSTMWLPMFLLEGLTFCAVAFFAITRLGQTAHCLLSMTDICNLH